MPEEFAWLKSSVLTMGYKTLEAVDNSITSILMKDTVSAANARGIEKQIDDMYHTINEYCLNALANQAYTRININFLVNSLKIAIELERIGDYANQIAKIEQKKLSKQNTDILDPVKNSVAKMKTQTVDMLKSALLCYENFDAHLVQSIIDMDDAVDQKNRELFRQMICLGSINPWSQEVVMDCYTVVRYIERVGDRATNIAELVYYIIKGTPLKAGGTGK